MQTTPYIPKTQKKETFASRVKEAGLLPEKIGQWSEENFLQPYYLFSDHNLGISLTNFRTGPKTQSYPFSDQWPF